MIEFPEGESDVKFIASVNPADISKVDTSDKGWDYEGIIYIVENVIWDRFNGRYDVYGKIK